MTILIADDNARMRALIKQILSDGNREFLECSNGAEAVALFRSHHPDFVVMDIEMPSLDGIEATQSICRESINAKVIILTQHNKEIYRVAAYKAGATSFVLKEKILQLRTLISE